MKTDLLTRFLIEDQAIRGEFVILHKTTRELMSEQFYPPAIRSLLGQMACASLLLSGTLKITGSTSIQAKGSGPLTSIMAESTHQRTCRGIALWQQHEQSDGLATVGGATEANRQDINPGLSALLGNDALLVITLTPEQGQRYQGIVSLANDELSACLEDYFARSEQLNTMIRLFDAGDYWGGFLLQQLPVQTRSEETDENWREITMISDTLSFAEMLETDSTTLLRRLFHQHDVSILQDEPVQFLCTCSEERSLHAIKSLGREEVFAIIAEQGAINMDCQFCNHHYHFDAKKINQLFDDPTLH